jgi:amino acid transporter
MNSTLVVVYLVVWAVCAVGSVVVFLRRDPQFTLRWYRRVAGFNFVVIGGFLLVLVAQMSPPWWYLVFFIGVALFIGWVSLFQTRVCPQCGKISQPDNLVTAPTFCRKCGARLDRSDV